MRRYVKPKIVDPASPKSRTLEDCSICLGHLKLSTATSCDRILELKACSHYFHESCLTIWLESKSECPLCRTSIFSWHVSTIKHCNITNCIPNVSLTLNQTVLFRPSSQIWERLSLGFPLSLFRPTLSLMWSFRDQGKDLGRNRHFKNFLKGNSWIMTHVYENVQFVPFFDDKLFEMFWTDWANLKGNFFNEW